MTNEEALKELREWRELAVNRGSYYGKNAIDVYDTAISALESQRWIPVTERLPKERGLFIVAYHPCYWDDVEERTEIGTDTFLGKDKWSKRKYQRVTHWMPLPLMPKEEST